MASAHRRPALAVVVGVVILQVLLVPLFVAPAANLAPRDLPVVVAGPASAADQLASRLDAAQPGAFDITRVPDADAADRALREREAYGAFVIGPDGMEVHTASAASPAVAQLLAQAAAAGPGGETVTVVDVVPAEPDDPRGAGLAAGLLPLVLTSVVAAAALLLLVAGRRVRLAGLLAYAVLSGLVATAVLQQWLGVIGGDYLPVAAAVALVTLAVSAAVTGFGAALGRTGAALAVVLVFLVGNPLSAVAAAPELLPQPWGQVGQWLPPGAGATLLRSVAWFDGAGATTAAWVLAGWAVVGLLLTLVGGARLVPPSDESAVPAPAPEPPSAGRHAA